MNFNKHSNLVGLHAFLSPSKISWLNYSEDKLAQTYINQLAVERGTELHDLASRLIKMGVKLPKTKNTLNMFVNDAIGFKMNSEQPLFYSENCFGTADAISFRRERQFDKDVLRISDLKTGETKAHIEQLEIYAALFCLEYGIKPSDIEIILRIYQYNDIFEHFPQTDDIVPVMDKIVTSDKIISAIKNEEKN